MSIIQTSNHSDGDGGVASDMDAYKENCFALVLDISKHSHFRHEDLEIIILENIPSLATLTGFASTLLLCMVLIDDLHLVMFLVLIAL